MWLHKTLQLIFFLNKCPVQKKLEVRIHCVLVSVIDKNGLPRSINSFNMASVYQVAHVQSQLRNKHIITTANKHISGIFNVIHPDLMVTVGVLSKTLSI